MKKVISIAHYTFIETLRNKIVYMLIFFGAAVVFASLVLSALGGEQSKRILLDMGLAAIEFFALLASVFAAVTLVLEEMDSKTIYLVLTRPVGRAAYLIGRFAGLLLSIFTAIILMAAAHIAVLLLNGWVFTPKYMLAVFLCAEKIMVISSLAVFFSLFSTSAVSSISFTVFLWILGHFSEELSFLGTKITNIFAQAVVKISYYIIPNLQYFNIRDFWDVPGVAGGWIFASFAYGLAYCTFFMGLSVWLFKNKEF